MNTYKNVEIAEEFNISKAAVTRWIENALEGKNNLQLSRLNNKVQVIKNEHNRAELKKLSIDGLIFKNKAEYAETSPTKHFYDTFSENQVIEIINNLKNKKEIPIKFSYLDGGAKIWESLSESASVSGVSTAFTVTPHLLDLSYQHILSRLEEGQKVNIIELGAGDCTNL
jgi:predicted DNA-binding protein YlxM (UPF0122 family)